MSSLVCRSVSAICFIMISCCYGARVRLNGQRELQVSRATQEHESTLDLAVESNITAGPPKEDCSLHNLNHMSAKEATPIKEAIRAQAYEVCKAAISRNYAEYSVDSGQIFVALQLSVSSRKDKQFWEGSASYNICGFVSLKVKHASVHVDLICSHMGYGGLLLQQAEEAAASIGKPYTDLDAVPAAREFYEYKGYKHCANPCVPENCPEKHSITQDGLFIMKKCVSSIDASRAPPPFPSTGIKVAKDITQFFVNGGSEDLKTFTWNSRTYRCCCSLKNLCHLVVEGRDDLPIFWRTGLQGCGVYVENSHSWNFWGKDGKCRIEDGSLNFQDLKALDKISANESDGNDSDYNVSSWDWSMS